MSETSVLRAPSHEALEGPIGGHGLSQVGAGRPLNEDHYVLAGLPDAGLFAVADGLGGAPEGDRASRMAVRGLLRALRGGWSDPETALRDAVLRAQAEIEEDVGRHPLRFGMGTTLTAALVIWPKVHVVHVGDSRCYALRGSRVERLTSDHTIASQMEGAVPKIVELRWRKVLTNVVGGRSSDVLPEITSATLKPGDGLLLTTDGVTDALTDDMLFALTRPRGTAEEVCRRVIAGAQERGAKDDLTVVYARFGRPPAWRRLRELFW